MGFEMFVMHCRALVDVRVTRPSNELVLGGAPASGCLAHRSTRTVSLPRGCRPANAPSWWGGEAWAAS